MKKIGRCLFLGYHTVTGVLLRSPLSFSFYRRGADKGLAISTLKVHVAAFSVLLDFSVAESPLLIRFFRTLARSRPVRLKHFPQMGSVGGPSLEA